MDYYHSENKSVEDDEEVIYYFEILGFGWMVSRDLAEKIKSTTFGQECVGIETLEYFFEEN